MNSKKHKNRLIIKFVFLVINNFFWNALIFEFCKYKWDVGSYKIRFNTDFFFFQRLFIIFCVIIVIIFVEGGT